MRAAVYIVLPLAAAVTAYGGVLSGLQQAWFGAAWFFTISAVTVVSVTSVVLQQRIEGSFERLAGTVSGKSGPIRLEERFKLSPAAIFVMVSGVVMFSLSILAAFRERWLAVCALLAGTLITNVISSALVLAQRIRSYAERLQELISQNREDRMPKEPPIPELD